MWELDYQEGEHQNIDAFEQWYWRKLLTVPWTARRSNQSIIKEISSEYSREGLILKLKLHLMQRTDSLENTLMLGNIEGKRRRGWDGWMASPTQWIWGRVCSRRWWWTRKPVILQPMGLQRVRHDWVTELNWGYKLGFPGGSVTQNPPANAGGKGLIPELGDPLEEEMTVSSSILTWEILRIEESGRLQYMDSQWDGHG